MEPDGKHGILGAHQALTAEHHNRTNVCVVRIDCLSSGGLEGQTDILNMLLLTYVAIFQKNRLGENIIQHSSTRPHAFHETTGACNANL